MYPLYSYGQRRHYNMEYRYARIDPFLENRIYGGVFRVLDTMNLLCCRFDYDAPTPIRERYTYNASKSSPPPKT